MDTWPRWRNVPALKAALRPLSSRVVASVAGGGGGMWGLGSTLSGESAVGGGESGGGGGERGGGGGT
jgi:hypothetical protein